MFDKSIKTCYTKSCSLKNYSSDNSEGVTPVPIPNTEVKPFSADGTWWETAWESRTSLDGIPG